MALAPSTSALSAAIDSLRVKPHIADEQYNTLTDDNKLLRDAPREVALSIVARYREVTPDVLKDENLFINALEGVLRPGGMLICDVELATLRFENGRPANEKLYDGVRAAYTACRRQGITEAGRAPRREAELKVVSGHAYFETRPDHTLQGFGVMIELDDIYRKIDTGTVINLISKMSNGSFPWTIRMRLLDGNNWQIVEHRVGDDDFELLNAEFDIVVGPEQNGSYLVSGKAIDMKRKWNVNSDGAMGIVLRLLAERHLTPRGLTPNSSVVSVSDTLRMAHKDERAASVISSIKRNFKDQLRHDMIPVAVNGDYQFSENAKVAIIRD